MGYLPRYTVQDWALYHTPGIFTSACCPGLNTLPHSCDIYLGMLSRVEHFTTLLGYLPRHAVQGWALYHTPGIFTSACCPGLSNLPHSCDINLSMLSRIEHFTTLLGYLPQHAVQDWTLYHTPVILTSACCPGLSTLPHSWDIYLGMLSRVEHFPALLALQAVRMPIISQGLTSFS